MAERNKKANENFMLRGLITKKLLIVKHRVIFGVFD